MSFQKGDRVIVNGDRIAVILSYDEGSNLVIYQAGLAGGGTDTVTSPISHTRLEAYPLPDGVVHEPEAEPEAVPDEK